MNIGIKYRNKVCMFVKNRTMSTDKLIEIRRVLSDKEKNNIESAPETIEADRVRSFRGWHKGGKDVQIKGSMTLIVMKPDPHNPKERPETILIEESYQSFSDRMAVKVPIMRLNEAD